MPHRCPASTSPAREPGTARSSTSTAPNRGSRRSTEPTAPPPSPRSAPSRLMIEGRRRVAHSGSRATGASGCGGRHLRALPDDVEGGVGGEPALDARGDEVLGGLYGVADVGALGEFRGDRGGQSAACAGNSLLAHLRGRVNVDVGAVVEHVDGVIAW